MIKLIIFDIGGVIDTFDESKYVSYITKKLKLDPIQFRKALNRPLDEMEVGRLGLKEAESILSKKFKVSVRSLEWNEAFKRLNNLDYGVVRLMNRLSKHYKIVLLTNISRSRHIVKMQGLLKVLKYDALFASCYMKMAKPDPRIYRTVLKKMKANANEAIFIDNLQRNVEGARKVGIHSIRFTNCSALIKHLKALGIE
jgi:epoxide hydrolase-like predicted phosphatase